MGLKHAEVNHRRSSYEVCRRPQVSFSFRNAGETLISTLKQCSVNDRLFGTRLAPDVQTDLLLSTRITVQIRRKQDCDTYLTVNPAKLAAFCCCYHFLIGSLPIFLLCCKYMQNAFSCGRILYPYVYFSIF